mgnify:FL=1
MQVRRYDDGSSECTLGGAYINLSVGICLDAKYIQYKAQQGTF